MTAEKTDAKNSKNAKGVVVVTGASEGIGYEIARAFVQVGYRVYGLSRRASGPDGVIKMTADVSDDASLGAAFKKIGEESGKVDILINNAGFGISGAAEFADENALAQMDVNFMGALRCISLALPLMRPGGGRIVNISSLAAVFPIPFQAIYSASKAAVNALSLALANELKGFGIQVCAIMPGDVNTGFSKARRKISQGGEIYGGIIESAVAVMENDEAQGMAPELIGRRVFEITTKRRLKPLYTIGAKYKLFLFLQRILPARAVVYILGMMYIKG
ncbi:MAG: SDR family NAD(P)-dependent oxidoreductase [Christensenellales bacterium]|jgi:NAD(P)-dependent dehydrogenase (short-subunit alcohol dehydrogenase family)